MSTDIRQCGQLLKAHRSVTFSVAYAYASESARTWPDWIIRQRAHVWAERPIFASLNGDSYGTNGPLPGDHTSPARNGPDMVVVVPAHARLGRRCKADRQNPSHRMFNRPGSGLGAACPSRAIPWPTDRSTKQIKRSTRKEITL